ncbi:hypothetical protein TNCV_671091 [Trichonephila clavipes]|nr:hypothetical protein TNCV_671091 [Trichonephila clavipes]
MDLLIPNPGQVIKTTPELGTPLEITSPQQQATTATRTVGSSDLSDADDICSSTFFSVFPHGVSSSTAVMCTMTAPVSSELIRNKSGHEFETITRPFR